jgi:hypothetical protein
MNKKIEFNYDGVDYTLEYNRDAIVYMENRGLDMSAMGSKSVTMAEILWQGAFLVNHKKETFAKIQEIFQHIPNKSELVSNLIEMVGETYAMLIGDKDEEDKKDDSKNIEWKMS